MSLRAAIEAVRDVDPFTALEGRALAIGELLDTMRLEVPEVVRGKGPDSTTLAREWNAANNDTVVRHLRSGRSVVSERDAERILTQVRGMLAHVQKKHELLQRRVDAFEKLLPHAPTPPTTPRKRKRAPRPSARYSPRVKSPFPK